MKNKISGLIICCLIISASASAQDSLHKSNVHKNTTHKSQTSSSTMHHSTANNTKPAKKPMYRDTRLGSSTKKYDTYKKNDKGAGAVTTSPK